MLDDAADLRELLAGGARRDRRQPVDGFQGHGVRLLRRDEIDPVALLAELRAEEMFSDWLIQRRLHNHPVVAGITGSATLETLRIVTFVERSGEVSVLYADHRLALVEGTVDNLRGGRTRNGVAPVGSRTGCSGSCGAGASTASASTTARRSTTERPSRASSSPTGTPRSRSCAGGHGDAAGPDHGWDVRADPEAPWSSRPTCLLAEHRVRPGSAAARIERA